jgi:hypothetical protein
MPAPRGNCYVTSESLYHLLGGRAAGWVPQTLRHEGVVHWYLKNEKTGAILDATVMQFSEPPDYSKGRGRGFLTKRPSFRAMVLMANMVWQ